MKRPGILVLLVSSVAWGQSKPASAPATAPAGAMMNKPAGPMPQPMPDKLDEGLKPFVGSWSCQGKETLPGMPEFSYKSKVTNKWDLGSFWLAIHYAREKTKATPAFEATAFWGYDNAMKKFIYVGLDSWGGHLHATSAGPKGNTISWEGEASAMGQGMPITFTVTRDDKGHGLKFGMDSGGQKIFEDTCK